MISPETDKIQEIIFFDIENFSNVSFMFHIYFAFKSQKRSVESERNA